MNLRATNGQTLRVAARLQVSIADLELLEPGEVLKIQLQQLCQLRFNRLQCRQAVQGEQPRVFQSWEVHGL